MIRHWFYAAAAFVSAIGVARILFLLLFRRPVQAKSCGTDLTEMQRLYDRDMYRLARVDGRPTPDDIPVRVVSARVAYEIEGIEHRADVRLLTPKGDRADIMPVVWYDPSDPRRVTCIGIAPSAMLLVFAGGLAVLGYHCPF